MNMPFPRKDAVQTLLSRFIKIIIGLILIVILIPAIYIFWGYYKINRDFTAKEHYVVQPRVDAGSLSEVGVVRQSRTVTCIKNRTKRLYLWINIPATHKQYLCEWQHGFSGFKKDDMVTMIYKIEGTDTATDYTGYLIGLHGKIKDKSSSIWTHGVEDTKD
jgi:hypothetical protein